MFAQIAIENRHYKTDILYTYRVNENMQGDLILGHRVTVPFGVSNKPIIGYVMDIIYHIEDKIRIKDIIMIMDEMPILNPMQIEIIKWMHYEYVAYYIDCIHTVISKAVREMHRYHKTQKKYFLELPYADIVLSKNAKKQKAIIDAIHEKEGISKGELKSQGLGDAATLRNLMDKGYIKLTETKEYRQVAYIKKVEGKNKLNQEQEKAMVNIDNSFKKKKPVLLHGITGSGKTEIYLDLIEKQIEIGKSSIVLVPEISLTPQIIGRFKNRFGERVAVMHSGLSEGEKADEWYRIKHGMVNVAIGARSAVFAPFDSLGLIIIDEEHEQTYKSESAPKYVTVDIARKRCELEGAGLVLGSATPSIMSYYRAKNGEYSLVEIKNRANGKPLPPIFIVDMRNELKGGNKTIFSSMLHKAIINTMENGEQLMLFLNRRGYSTFISCRECGHVLECPECSISLTYHIKSNKLNCHYCGHEETAPSICPSCGSKQIRYFGIGTQKIEEAFCETFGTNSTIRMDADTTTQKNSHMLLLDKFRRKEAKALIGTQMIAKGHDFPEVTLVGIVAADMGIFSPDYRAAERSFQLLEQVAGRSGRADKEGKVIVQTYNPEHYSIEYASKHDYNGFYGEEIKLREILKYPPFADILNIIISGEKEEEVTTISQRLRVTIMEEFDVMSFEILGPTPATIDKIKKKHRWQIILKSQNKMLLRDIMRFITYRDNYQSESVIIAMDINPNTML